MLRVDICVRSKHRTHVICPDMYLVYQVPVQIGASCVKALVPLRLDRCSLGNYLIPAGTTGLGFIVAERFGNRVFAPSNRATVKRLGLIYVGKAASHDGFLLYSCSLEVLFT